MNAKETHDAGVAAFCKHLGKQARTGKTPDVKVLSRNSEKNTNWPLPIISILPDIQYVFVDLRKGKMWMVIGYDLLLDLPHFFGPKRKTKRTQKSWECVLESALDGYEIN